MKGIGGNASPKRVKSLLDPANPPGRVRHYMGRRLNGLESLPAGLGEDFGVDDAFGRLFSTQNVDR
jgi:hypothetical protein